MTAPPGWEAAVDHARALPGRAGTVILPRATLLDLADHVEDLERGTIGFKIIVTAAFAVVAVVTVWALVFVTAAHFILPC